MFRILALSGIFLLLSSSALSADSSMIHIGQKAELFRKWHRVQDNYMLITGPIEFQEEDTDLHSKGYRVSSANFLSGEIVREIFDYPVNQSPVNIFEQVGFW